MSKILIVGCGELGSRFLQAVVAMDEIKEVDIVEPQQQARETAVQRMNAVGRDISTIQINWFSDLAEKITPGDMAIITTHADIRLSVFEKVLTIGYRHFIVEKIVTQSLADYHRMMELATSHHAGVWVNCKTRNYPVWEYIKTKIDTSKKITFHSVGGNHGLCTNGLHTIDLFVFLTGAKDLIVTGTRFDHFLHKTKRGKYDVSGTLQVEDPASGSTIVLDYVESHMSMPLDIIVAGNDRWMVDNAARQAFESNEGSKNVFYPVPFEGDMRVSGTMTMKYVRDILTTGSCILPTLGECFLAHRIVFEATLPLFNELLNKHDDYCPIT